MSVTVIIPALNTEATIMPIIDAWVNHPAVDRVLVCVDWATTDNTLAIAKDKDVITLTHPTMQGKGQCVNVGLNMTDSAYVAFCDSDIRGLSPDHISLLIADSLLESNTMTLGIPDMPANYPKDRAWAWPWVTGQRCLPTDVVRPLHLHGYLMETQINTAAKHAETKVRLERLIGVKSDYMMTANRVQRMEEDRRWAIRHGVLSDGRR
jgi:glycosyltransferase involved in cell wall biosynthesis